MVNTEFKEPFKNTPLFEPWGDEDTHTYKPSIKWDGADHEVIVKFSLAKKEARQVQGNAGSLDYGKHAGKNIGVSIVRAGRELILDNSWAINYDTVERWWAVELDFPPSLDELFGVTNNKQSANNFTELSKLDWDSLLKGGKTVSQLKEDFEDTDDPKAPLLELAQRIDQGIKAMRGILKIQAQGSRSETRYELDTKAEEKATKGTETRALDGHEGGSDKKDKNLTDEEKREELEGYLEEAGLDKEDSKSIIEKAMKEGLKYVFVKSDLESSAFFSVRSKGGKIVVSININHPAYSNLVEVLEEDTNSFGEDELVFFAVWFLLFFGVIFDFFSKTKSNER
jgi:hypothetical protein